MKNSRILLIFVLMVAGLCLFRVLSVAAATRDNDDIEERYAAMERGNDSDDSDGSSQASDSDDSDDDQQQQDEIRITRPDEAASRVADEGQGYDLVPGAAKYAGAHAGGGSSDGGDSSDNILVPKRAGRKIASDATADVAPPSPIEVRPEAAVAPSPTQGELSPDVMEPKPFTRRDAEERASHYSRDSLVASNAPGEPGVDPQLVPPMPVSASISRSGVQEISLIASDFGYFPKQIFVTQNVPVKLYLTTSSKSTLCFMLDNFGLRKGIAPGQVEELVFMPNAPGNYRFYCPVKSIEGTITVREAPVAVQSMRGVASRDKGDDEEDSRPKADSNTPKRAAKLRQLIED